MTGIAPYTDNTRWWPGEKSEFDGSQAIADHIAALRARAEAAEAEVERLTPRRDSAEIKVLFADAPQVVAAMKAAEDALAQAVAEVERLRAKLDAAREAWLDGGVCSLRECCIGESFLVEPMDAALEAEEADRG